MGERSYRFPAHVRDDVLADPCAYCGDPASTNIDHIIPVMQGGTRERDNLAPACKPCNLGKSGQTPEQWKASREARGLSWPPPTFEQWLEGKR